MEAGSQRSGPTGRPCGHDRFDRGLAAGRPRLAEDLRPWWWEKGPLHRLPTKHRRQICPAQASQGTGGTQAGVEGTAGPTRPHQNTPKHSRKESSLGGGDLSDGWDGQDRPGLDRRRGCPPQTVVLCGAVRGPAQSRTRSRTVVGRGGTEGAAEPDGCEARRHSPWPVEALRPLPEEAGRPRPQRQQAPSGAGGRRQRQQHRPGTPPAAQVGRAPTDGHQPQRPAPDRNSASGPERPQPQSGPEGSGLCSARQRRPRPRQGRAETLGRTVRLPSPGVGDRRRPPDPQPPPDPEEVG